MVLLLDDYLKAHQKPVIFSSLPIFSIAMHKKSVGLTIEMLGMSIEKLGMGNEKLGRSIEKLHLSIEKVGLNIEKHQPGNENIGQTIVMLFKNHFP